MNSIEDEILEEDGANLSTNKLTPFLSIITMLTFVGSGSNIFSGLFSMVAINELKDDIDIAKEITNDVSNVFGQRVADLTIAALENIYPLQIGAIIVALICIAGAFFMRKLKRIGFYIYLIGAILSVVIPANIVGMDIMGGFIILAAIPTITFVIMYSVNLKYMR